MDKFVSILAFPIGLTLCFWPAILLWLKLELNDDSSDRADRRDKR